MTPPAEHNIGSMDIVGNAIDQGVMSGVNEAITVKEVAKFLKPISSKMSIDNMKKIVCDHLVIQPDRRLDE